MSNRKTDNSYFPEKVRLRLDHIPNKKEIRVLDCYSGDGLIWKDVQRKTKNKLKILSIEVKNTTSRVYIRANNLKILKGIYINDYDVIDLDAYGIPYEQLNVIFKRGFKGHLFITFIQSQWGALPKKFLYSLGYTRKMIDKCPTLFNRDGFEKLCQYLSTHGITKVLYYQTPDKRTNYIYVNAFMLMP